MENRFRRFLLAILLLLSAGTLQAATLDELGAEIDIDRREIDEAAIDSENFEVTIAYGLLSIEGFDSNDVIIGRIAYHITEDFFAEASLGESRAGLTSVEQYGGGLRLMSDDERDYSYYNISLGYNLLPGESFISSGRAFNSALFLIGGVGVTSFAGNDYFTANFGAGYRLLVNDWLAVRFDFRDHIFNSDIISSNKQTHNLEMAMGIGLFF